MIKGNTFEVFTSVFFSEVLKDLRIIAVSWSVANVNIFESCRSLYQGEEHTDDTVSISANSASRPDEVNGEVHETAIIRKPFGNNTFELLKIFQLLFFS